MPTPPQELTTLGPKPAIPPPGANDYIFSIFVDNERSALDSCYASHQDLIDWIYTTKQKIEASNPTPTK